MSMVTSSGPQVFLLMVNLESFEPLEVAPTVSTDSISGIFYPERHTFSEQKFPLARGHPYMTSTLRGGGGVSPKRDVVREVS